jgi:hypothetical protein
MILPQRAEAPEFLSAAASFVGHTMSMTRSISQHMKPDTRDANDAAARHPNIILQS